METPIRHLQVQHLHQPHDWLSPAYLEISTEGMITAVLADRPSDWPSDARSLKGYCVPGLGNLHSHAFQRLMAGRAEHAPARGGGDNFWSWREQMYRIADRLEPEDLHAVAAQLYVEMLEVGYTSVGEFHYLHHQVDGTPFDQPAELSLQILSAARLVGIGLTLLPVLYAHAGIGKPLAPEQRRFGHEDPEQYLRLLDQLRPQIKAEPRQRLGIAPHSLRAVSRHELEVCTTAALAADLDTRIHIHIAEQAREVEEVLAATGQRPVAWLHDSFEVDANWCLIHATHVDHQERSMIAKRGAIAGICPSTEANLGDGLFPIPEFLVEGGKFGIGSDSQVTVSPAEELRLLEYGQRLSLQERNLCIDERSTAWLHVGRRLFDGAVEGGAQALDQGPRALIAGERADLVILDSDAPRLVGHGVETILDAWMFSANDRSAVREVYVAGQRLVTDGKHRNAEAVLRRFKAVCNKLFDA